MQQAMKTSNMATSQQSEKSVETGDDNRLIQRVGSGDTQRAIQGGSTDHARSRSVRLELAAQLIRFAAFACRNTHMQIGMGDLMPEDSIELRIAELFAKTLSHKNHAPSAGHTEISECTTSERRIKAHRATNLFVDDVVKSVSSRNAECEHD